MHGGERDETKELPGAWRMNHHGLESYIIAQYYCVELHEWIHAVSHPSCNALIAPCVHDTSVFSVAARVQTIAAYMLRSYGLIIVSSEAVTMATSEVHATGNYVGRMEVWLSQLCGHAKKTIEATEWYKSHEICSICDRTWKLCTSCVHAMKNRKQSLMDNLAEEVEFIGIRKND